MLTEEHRKEITVNDRIGRLPVYVLKRFLKIKSWRLANSTQNLFIYEGSLDDDNRPIRLVLPTHEEYLDTPVIVLKAVKLLACIENCPIEDMYQMIMNLLDPADFKVLSKS